MDYQEDAETAMEDDGEEEKVTQERLNELHRILEKEWGSFERSFKRKTHRSRSSTGSDQRSPPSQETWNVRNNELALKEIVRRRNGRRLFEEEGEMGLGIMADMFEVSSGYDEKTVVRSLSEYGSGEENEDVDGFLDHCSYSSTASSIVENVERKEENRREKTARMAEERSFNDGGQRFRIFRGFVAAVASAIFGFCIFSMSKIEEDEDILAPT